MKSFTAVTALLKRKLGKVVRTDEESLREASFDSAKIAFRPEAVIRVKKEADIGFQQVSELIHFPGIVYVGPLPQEVQQITTFSAGLHKDAKETNGTNALVKFLTGPVAKPVIKKNGMEPG